MTFEQYVKQWLEEKVGQELYSVIKEESISVQLDDNLDVGDPWMRNAVFGIYCKFKQKTDAARAAELIKKSLPQLRNENYINKAYLESEIAERVGLPPIWQYTLSVRIVYRRRDEW